MNKARCQVSHRIFGAVTALMVVIGVLLLAPGPAGGQAFWREDTPKIPMAATWLAEKAELPPYNPPRTSEGVPNLQGVWGGAGGDGLSYLEDHEYVDVTTPAQESFVSDPPNGKIPYTPWGLAKRNEILAGLGRGWPGESGERLYSSPASFCLNFMPRFSFSELEIVQQPGSVIMLGEEGYRVTLRRYAHGLSTLAELLDATTAATRARLLLITAATENRIAAARSRAAMAWL